MHEPLGSILASHEIHLPIHMFIHLHMHTLSFSSDIYTLVMEIVQVEDRLRSHPEKNVHEQYTV